ncbi:zf-CHY-domain-containing protein [Piedraia hortae CBS 480.64]|uniref:Zf-CHY-domain-containing protein n=1 Tax=Piedraia hortae CBS 480.64 TaxID=1314780 RepID=A0A6A7C9P7_9PEZI|nr:zf-CHY-domain-containing protein [Piedraia hortae CBS 480.64]
MATSHVSEVTTERGDENTWVAETRAESPTAEVSEGDDVGRLPSTADAPWASRARRRQPGSGSYSSWRSWRSGTLDGSRSLNPGREVEGSLRRTDTLQSTTTDTADMAAVQRALPPDDGMSDLRQQLQEVRALAVSTEEKARRMHRLMMQRYRQKSPEEPMAPVLPEVDSSNPYAVLAADREPSYCPGKAFFGCMHYKRNVKVQCHDCWRWYTCRHCHDAAELPFPHQLNRKKTENMLCMFCHTAQPAAEQCTSCGKYAAWYYCAKCKLWNDDVSKRIYHCDSCGICRVGEGLGKDFVHCERCNVCISISAANSHPCIERATEGDCPLCLAHLFESPKSVVSLPCGHYMHGDCYRDLMAVTYKCPVCSKSAVNMDVAWRKLDDEIRAQPMPEEVLSTSVREVFVACNDCGSRSWSPFHWLGLKCQICDSYNTIHVVPTARNESEAERLLRQQQLQLNVPVNVVRSDAAFEVSTPSSPPAQLAVSTPSSVAVAAPPADEGISRSAPHSSAPTGRRYFVQDEPSRRSSFTTVSFPTPSMPSLPHLPEIPHIIPRATNMMHLPDLPRFSAAEMFDAFSRSLSPMRYYIPGMERSSSVGRPPGEPCAGSASEEGAGRKTRRTGEFFWRGLENSAFGDESDSESSEEDDDDDLDRMEIELPGHR